MVNPSVAPIPRMEAQQIQIQRRQAAARSSQTVLDGKWRSLDGRPMHAAVVALSELHESLFADALTRSLGVQWERRERGRDRHSALSISAVPEPLVAEFSSRSR